MSVGFGRDVGELTVC